MDWDLTERQRDVLRRYVDGATTPEIAEALRRRRDGEHVDDCLGEATESAIRRAITRST